MVRTYKKKKKQYNEVTIAVAINEVMAGSSITITINYVTSISYEQGRKIFLGTELEDKLKNLLKRMEKMGLGPTIMEFQDIVYDYLTANEISTPFKHNRPGRDWVNSFLLRHNMTLKKGG